MKELISVIKKDWKTCSECPMNYDHLDCRLYKDEYRKGYIDEFEPTDEIPGFCELEQIEFFGFEGEETK